MTFSKTSAELARFMLDLTDGKQEVSYAGGTVGDGFFRNVEQIAAYVPYMPSHGNHEN